MYYSRGKDYRQNILSFLASATPPSITPAKPEPEKPKPIPEPDENEEPDETELRILGNEQYPD